MGSQASRKQVLRKPANDEKAPKKEIDKWQKNQGDDAARLTKTIRMKDSLWKQIRVFCAGKGESVADFMERAVTKELGQK